MGKQLEDADSLRYKENYEKLLAIVNQKPSEEILEKLREKYRIAREGK
jgi:hypothetical protein